MNYNLRTVPMTSRTFGVVALVLASLLGAERAAAQGPRERPGRPAAPFAAECGARGPSATPVISRVDPGPTGYVIVGRCFGQDRAALRVWEGTAAVPTALVASMTDRRIEVRSTPQGVVEHRVGIGGTDSNVVTVTHCRCDGHGVCDARGVCTCHAGWSGPACNVTAIPR